MDRIEIHPSSPVPDPVAPRPRMTRSLMWLFAVAGGAAVGNLYYAQPLLNLIARSFRVGQGTAGFLVTATQLGYAAGILLVVPLGDIRDRRRLVPRMMALSAAMLVACALAPDFAVLAVALVAVGVTTVSAQILTPFAGDLADDASRGRVLGIVVSGLITGILIARIISGFIAGAAGWRTVFAFAAGLMVVLAVLLHWSLPVVAPKTSASYGSLLRSVGELVIRERVLQISMVFGVITMANFTIFWTSLTFLLSGSPYHYSSGAIGLFGVAGLLGSVTAQWSGRIHDRGWSAQGAGLSWVLAIGAWGVSYFGGRSLPLLLVGVVALDIATQSQRILNQSRIFAISTEARSRVNTAYVAGNFLGGAAGSVLASLLWSTGKWDAIVVAGAALSFAALGVWVWARRQL